MFKLIYKKKGISSFKAISNFAHENNIKKIGHTGTLDPMATGLLLVATDDDTKLIEYITNKNKVYIAEATFNIETDSYDSDGKVVNTFNKVITLEMIKKMIPSFIGKINQIPPIFSAKKVNGKRSYELARQNKKVVLNSSLVEIYNINIIFFSNSENKLSFEASVSNGTYIRSLIHDMGKYLGTGAIMSKLERTMIHGLSKKDTKINFKSLINLPFISLNDDILKKLLNGQPTNIIQEDDKYGIIYEVKNDIVGIIEIKDNVVTNRKMFGNKLGINNV